jgi:ABC-type nitrate/sulfonate/bicarbonate transport system permease component
VKRVSSFAHRWTLFAVLVALWELVTRSASDPFFPPPSEIVPTAVALWFTGPPSHLFLGDVVFDHVVPSLGRVIGGWLLAALVGIGLGLLLGRSRTATNYVGGLLHFFRAIPPTLLVPFFLVTLGLDNMAIGTIVFGAVWPILLNTIEGARTVDAVKVDTARAFRLSTAQWMLGVVLPAALPKVFAGLRLSLSIAVILMVIAELIGPPTGIGRQLVDAQRDYELPTMWAWMVLLGVLGYLFNSLLLIGERRALRWQPRHTLQTKTVAVGG